jgi:hypothetical protein
MMPGLPPREQLTFGAIIGVVRVVDCVPYEEVKDRAFAEPQGRCWLLEEPRPIAMAGRLGPFEVPDEVIRAALEGPPMA